MQASFLTSILSIHSLCAYHKGRRVGFKGLTQLVVNEYAHTHAHQKEGGTVPATRRTQLLMDPDEFRRLRTLARQKKTSVAELIRDAVRATYLNPPREERTSIVEAIVRMKLPGMSWKKVRKEIEDSHARVP